MDNNEEKCEAPCLNGQQERRGRGGVGGTSRGGRGWLWWLDVKMVLVRTLEKTVKAGPICVAVGICLCCS